ncbi:hypothetical protein CEXT_437151, partial [Caerostris extrusa]
LRVFACKWIHCRGAKINSEDNLALMASDKCVPGNCSTNQLLVFTLGQELNEKLLQNKSAILPLPASSRNLWLC